MFFDELAILAVSFWTFIWVANFVAQSAESWKGWYLFIMALWLQQQAERQQVKWYLCAMANWNTIKTVTTKHKIPGK